MAKAKPAPNTPLQRRLKLNCGLLVERSPLTRRELAKQAGMSAPYLSQMLSGDRAFTLPAIEALAPLLGS